MKESAPHTLTASLEISSRRSEKWMRLGFTLSLLFVLTLGIIALLALRHSVSSDRVAFERADQIIQFGAFRSALERKMNAFSKYLASAQEKDAADLAAARLQLRRVLQEFRERSTAREQSLLDQVAAAEEAQHEAVQGAVDRRRSGQTQDEVAVYAVREIGPRRRLLEASVDRLLAFQRGELRQVVRHSERQNFLATILVASVVLVGIGLLLWLGWTMRRRLARSFQLEHRERRRAEAAGTALAESEERKSAILASALDAVITIDQDGRVTEFNPAAERIFGFTAAEAADREMAELLVPPRLRAQHREGMARYRKTGEGPVLGQRIEMPALRRDGSEVSIELAIRPIRAGRETLFTAFIRDITDRKQAEEERAQILERERAARGQAEAAEARSSFLAETSEVLGSSLDYRTTLSSVAQLAAPKIADWCFIDMLEEGDFRRVAVAHRWPEHDALARDLQERHLLDPDAKTGPPHVLRTGQAELLADVPDEFFREIAHSPEDYALLAQMGIRSYMCVPMRARGEILGLLTFLSTEPERRYTSDDLRLAQELARRAGVAIDNARLYRDAREAIDLRDEFLSIASHELKTPIATLQLQIQSLMRRVRASSDASEAEKLLPRLGTAERQVDRLTRLVNNLLDISRITAGRFDLEREIVDLEAVVREVLTRSAEELERAGCVASFSVEGPHIGLWDRTRIEQIFTNLLSNAAKYGARRPIEVVLTGDPDTSRLAVRDHGIGIAPEHQARIFDRFERAVSVRHYGGLGLGLWIVRQIVEALGGRISVESRPGEGSTFTVELPRQPQESSTPAEQATS